MYRGRWIKQQKILLNASISLLYLFLNRTYEECRCGLYSPPYTSKRSRWAWVFLLPRNRWHHCIQCIYAWWMTLSQKRYPPGEWNVYAAQASDGDNWADDSPGCKVSYWSREYFASNTPILLLYRNHSPLRIKRSGVNTKHCKSSLWLTLLCRTLRTVDDIFPVFRELFQKETA